MSASVNKVILVGSLGKDPEVRHTQAGKAIANLSVATSQSWKDQNTGERKEKTEWHKVVIFSEGLAKVAEQYLKKGARVYIEGQLQTRKWADQEGKERYSTEIVLQGFQSQLVMLDRANVNDTTTSTQKSFGNGGARNNNNNIEDEVPFMFKNIDRFPV